MERLTKALDLIEKVELLEAQGDLDCLKDEGDKPFEGNNFQNENVYNRLLPYDVTVESQEHLMRIKASLAKCIQLDQETIYEWFIDLERYVNLYGLAFTKEDHIYFVKLQYEFMVTSMDLYYVTYVAHCFSKLMTKRYLISSDELQLDWRPLYDTYRRLLESELESLGLRYVPESLESNLSQAIRLARPHFPIEATQEMLDEWRPKLCPFSVTIARAANYMNLFLPTTLPPEHHDKGFKLWFDEVIQSWLNCKVNTATYESKFTLLLSRLSSDCMGYIDWEPYIPLIFNHFKSSFNLNGGSIQSNIRRTNDPIDVGPCVQWIVYMINRENSCLDYITKLFKAIESFYHPSNTDRRWHTKLQQFLHRLPNCYVKRLYRERFKNNIWSRRIPESHKLTDEQTTKFVDALMPVVLTSMFNQAGLSYASLAFRDLSVLRPERVIPPLLERLYGSYETLTEPHRLLASINCMTSVVPAMVRPCKYFPQGPSHVIPLLLNSLPGIDSNDMRKCIAVFRFVATVAAHVRMKDYSYMVDERPDLTNEQQQLCLSTAQFEDFVVQFLDKCFILIENTTTSTFAHLDQESRLKSGEEGIIEAAISSVTLSILAQSSPEIQQAALEKIYYHVTNHIFDTKTRGKAIATLCLACAKSIPKETLSKFVPHFGRLILTLTDNDEVFQDSILDDELLFSLLLMSEIVRCNSSHILDYKEVILKVLNRALRLTAKEGYMLGCSILRHLLRALTNITCCDWRNIENDDEHCADEKESWPFDNWGNTTHIKDLKLKWEIPKPEAREFAQELLELFFRQAVQTLLDWSYGKRQLSREVTQRSLHIIMSSLVGGASVLPPLESRVVDLCPYEVPILPMCVKNTGSESLNFKDGTNIRTWVIDSMKKILQHIRIVNEDDSKSLVLVCEIFTTAIFYFGYNKTELSCAAQRIASMKSGSQNKLLGPKRHLRYLLVERVAQQHRSMLLCKGSPEITELHLEVFKNLFELAQGHYVDVRILAQDTIYVMLQYFPFLKTLLVPMLVKELKAQDIEHNKFKGLLYLVVGRRSYGSIVISPEWTFIRALWPALVESPHSEKPSIVKLLDRVCSSVQKQFDTFELNYSYPAKIKRIAAEVWNIGSVDPTMYPTPDETLIKTVFDKVKQRNQQRVVDYEALISRLVELIEDPLLHWHRRIMAYNLFTHLMRDDHPLPVPALKLCLSSLMSERLSIRTKAIVLLTAQLKMQKRKHLKLKSDRSKFGNSNKWLQYKLKKGNYSKEEWDKMIFIDKPYIGFYEYPRELEFYGKYEKQPQLNRAIEELNESELAVFKFMMDPNFIEKLVNYFCFEDNKGPVELKRFDTKRPALFKGLFRNFGPCMIEPFKKYVLEYSTSTCEQKQTFVIEFLAGLMRGSKHWSYEMMLELKDFVLPLIDQMTITQENSNDWSGFSNYVFRHRDIRRFEWLFNYFITKATSQEESKLPTVTPFIQVCRLALAHYSLVQCEWRAVDYIFPVVIENLMPQSHLLAYANIRTCLASIYSLIYLYDDPTKLTRIPGTLVNGPKRADFIDFVLPKLAILEKGKQSAASLALAAADLKSSLPQEHSGRHDRSAEGDENLISDGTKSRYIGEIQAAGPGSISMDTDTTDETDMVLIAETLMKFRQLDANSESPSSSDDHRHHEHHHHHNNHAVSDESKVGKECSVGVETGGRGSGSSFVENLRDALPNLSVSASTGASGSSISDQGVDSQERKDAINLMKFTSCWIIFNVCRMKSPVPADFFKLLPVICETGRENNDPELAGDSIAAVAILGSSTLSPEAIKESLRCVRKIIAEHSWHARGAAAAFIEIMVSSNLFKLISNEQWRAEIEDIVINHLICDERIEVRESSSLTLSGLIHCEFTKLTPELLNEFKRRVNEPLVKRKQPNGTTVIDAKSTVTRHSGILCLCACVDAYPYTVPDYLPSILTLLSDHLTDPQPISTTIKKTMSNFRRTHHDNWQSDKTKFTDDQLCILADLLVSPSYYA